MRVCFYTLGCKVNLNETGALEQMFRANGFTIAQENEPADVFVVNSCTVTNFGDQKSRKWLRRKKRESFGILRKLAVCPANAQTIKNQRQSRGFYIFLWESQCVLENPLYE